MRINLNLSLEEYEQLHKAAQGRKDKVVVGREALVKLLTDHAEALATLERGGIRAVDPSRRVRAAIKP